MDRRPGKPSDRSPEYDMQVGTSSAVLTRAFVAESLRREERKDDTFNAARGVIYALLISLAFWGVVGFILFAIS
jgi:hypothetical protein